MIRFVIREVEILKKTAFTMDQRIKLYEIINHDVG